MAEGMGHGQHRPIWVDLSSSDAAASRDFYARLFGWEMQVNDDPQYGGYALAQLNGSDVAGIGAQMSEGAPTAWTIYIGTADATAAVQKAAEAGGTVISEPFDIGDQGRMAIVQDPTGAFVGIWQALKMTGFQTDAAGSFGWAELSARGIEAALPFYRTVFGWTAKRSPMGEGQPDYIEFQVDGRSVAGGMEISPGLPAEVPSYWMAYFNVADVDDAYQRALAAGAAEMVAPSEFPGGRFAILMDPQGAMFGLLRT